MIAYLEQGQEAFSWLKIAFMVCQVTDLTGDMAMWSFLRWDQAGFKKRTVFDQAKSVSESSESYSQENQPTGIKMVNV